MKFRWIKDIKEELVSHEEALRMGVEMTTEAFERLCQKEKVRIIKEEIARIQLMDELEKNIFLMEMDRKIYDRGPNKPPVYVMGKHLNYGSDIEILRPLLKTSGRLLSVKRNLENQLMAIEAIEEDQHAS